MSIWPTIVRSIAVVFLLMTAAEIFGCELLSSPSCELTNPFGDSGRGGNPSGDECFCCCHHIVPVPPPISLTPHGPVALVVPTVADSVFQLFVPAIDQPPRG